jgi:hypothetical protein
MYQALPVHGFRWLEKEEFEHVNINSVSDDSEDGYILEVDSSRVHSNCWLSCVIMDIPSRSRNL